MKLRNKLKLKVGGLLFFFCLVIPVFPVEKNSLEITGIVADAETSEPIIGASVWIESVNKNAITDSEGRYRIKDLREGVYILRISCLSYKPVQVECHLHTPVTNLDISMESDELMLDDVVLRARIHSHTESGMVVTLRSLPQVASGVSAVQIARSPDRIASEVVRRISGVTLIDERFMVVRGLSQRYNNAWINGLGVPSTETDSRAFPFDLIPGSQIDNLLLYKSPSPEIPADFSGGFVMLTTKSVPDENRMEFNYTTGFHVNTHGYDFRINPGSNTDFLGFDLNKRPLPVSFPRHLDATTAGTEEITRFTKEGFNNDWRVENRFPLPDQRLSWMIARRIETGDHLIIGNITTLTYSNTFKRVDNMKNARYGIYAAEADKPVFLDNYSDNQFSNDVRMGVLHNWSFVPNPSNCIEFKNLLNIVGQNRLTERTGIKDISSPYYLEQTEMLYTSRLTYSGQFSGTHDFTPDQTLNWDAGYAYAGKNEPDRRVVTNQAGISEPESKVETANDNIKRYFQNLYDHNVSVSLNYKRTILPARGLKPVLKTGLYTEYANRSYSQREFIYRYDNLTSEERQIYLKLPFQEMLHHNYLDKVYIDEITRKTNAYATHVLHVAGYAAFEITWRKWLVYMGMRFENHYTALSRDRSDAPDLILMTTKKINDPNWFPSVNLNYKFTDEHQLRAAYGRSINRPELREISPSIYFDFDLFGEIGGNENLKTALIDNLDLRYEFYPDRGETVSVGLFYKHFKNPIEWTFIDMGGTLRYCYENAGRAESFGVEFDLRKKLDFLGAPGLSLTMNAALIESRVHFNPGEIVTEPDRNMQGQSPYIINAGLFYQNEKTGINASLLYNRIGKRIVGLGKSNSAEHNVNTLIPDSYEIPRNALDFTASKSIGKMMEIRLSIKDILSEDVVYKQFPKFEKEGVVYKREQIIRQYNPGQFISLGVSYKIN